NNCDDVKCVIGTTNGHLNVNASQNHMDSKCMAKEAAKGCFNTVPVSCAGSYAGLGYRPNGAGGNPKPRNHLGSDIGMAACKQGNKYVPVKVYAAADGVVKYVNTGGCSGRTVVIQHTKACKNAKDPSYKSTYRHLLQYKVSSGQSVKKGDVIGIVGGSNAGSIGAPPCDRGDQAGWPGYSTAGCAAAKSKCGTPNYAIHLHFEVEDGAASASSSQASASKAMSPNCGNLQVLCGGCPNNAGSCGGSGGGVFSDGSSASLEGGYSETYQNGNNYSADNTCVLAKYLDDADCKFCPMFRTFFNAASSVAKSANDALSGPSKALVSIGFLIWLCIYVLKHITNFGGTSTGDMLKGILFQGFRVAVVILILSNAVYAVMDLTLNPVMQTGLGFVNSLNESSKCQDDAPYMQDIMGYKSGAGDGNGGLSIDLGKSIICSIKKLEDATGFMLGLGKYSMCLAIDVYDWLLPHFGYFLTGLFLWLVGVLVLLTFPWCVADCLLQLCVAAALVPCAIAAYAFKITERYLKIVWNFFMNAMFNFVFLGLIVYIINSHLKDWIGMDIDDTSTFVDHIFIEGFSARGLAVWGIGFIKVAAIGFFCWTFFEESGDMAKKFAQSPGLGGSKGIAPMVGGTLGNIGQAAGAGTLKIGTKFGVGAAKGIGSATNSLVGNKFRSGMNHIKGKAISVLPKGKKIVDAAGNTVGYERNIRFLGRNISRSYKKDENGIWTSEKIVKKRSSADKAFEQVFDKNGNALKDANGNNVYRYRKRIFGITTGYEEMTAAENAEGNLVYRSASGKGNFTMDKSGNFTDYKTRFTMNFNNLSTRKMSKMYDKNGFAIKDAAGNDQYEVKHQLFGFTFKKEKMEALKDENGNIIQDNDGNIVYATEDKRNSFVMDREHKMNNVVTEKPFRTRTGERQVKNYQAKRVINDAFSKTTQTLDNNGNVISSETHFSNEAAKYLINKDGTINKMAFNQIKNGTKNAEAAASAMISEAMRFRNQALNTSYKERNVEIQEDGSAVINQLNNDGTRQIIHAQVIDDQMIIRNTTIQKSNGMQTLTEKYTRVVDESTGEAAYIYQSRLEFSDYLHQKNSRIGPLDAHGEWGHNLDAHKAMLGFTENDFRKHKAQVQMAQMRKMMGEEQYLAALDDPKSQVAKLAGLLNAGDINTYNRLRQLRNKMGAKEFEKASKDPNSEVSRLKKKLIAGSLSESAARIHAGQAMAGGLAVQLNNVKSMIDDKEKLLTAINEGKQEVSTKEKQILQNEIDNLKKAETELKQAASAAEKPQQQPDTTQPKQPETQKPGATQPETPQTQKPGATQPATPQTQKPSATQPATPQTRTQPATPQTQPATRLSYEEMINEIKASDVAPQRLVEIRTQLQQTAFADRNQDHAFVYDELQKKAQE
ncbi:MAG: peptidoglycan DD-metalloendopeptidase family protein, partial [Alphaproteobacteria bacterium]|nr:peptidoglycan DD-metalloendopeptidase family protein [Alphaproteobacteria bacterium]